MFPPLIGLTGGIGCGKTEVSKIFSRLGAALIDADKIGRDIVDQRPAIRGAIRSAFGPEFFDEEGSLLRKKLGTYIFQNPDKQALLNELVHPPLIDEIQRQISDLKTEKWPMIILDAALIFETGLDGRCDKVVVVAADDPFRVKRIMSRDGITESEAQIRIKAQIPLDEKIKKADLVIYNNGSLAELAAEAEDSFKRLVA